MGRAGGEGCRGAGHPSGMSKRFCSADVPRITLHLRLPAFRYAALLQLAIGAKIAPNRRTCSCAACSRVAHRPVSVCGTE